MSLYPLARNLLFRLDAEKSHDISLGLLKHLGQFAKILGHNNQQPVELLGLRFPNPVGLAAGLDKNGIATDAMAALGFGFVEIGTVTPVGQPGNPKPRIFRLPEHQAIINRMGFNNDGVEQLLTNIQPAKRSVPIGINIGKNIQTPVQDAVNDYLIGLRAAYKSADYITVNISSPNTPGLRQLQHGDYLNDLLATLRKEQLSLTDQHGFYRPLMVKVAPDLDDQEIIDIALCVERHQIDCIIATNTTQARDKIPGHHLAQEAGGLSGKPATEISTEIIAKLVRALDGSAPVIGVGGIMSAEDAKAKFQAGAQLIQLYTGFIYHGPPLINACVKAYRDIKND